MLLARSFWLKAIATTVAAVAFVSLYEVTILDSKYAARQAVLHEAVALPSPGSRVSFGATAYCKGFATSAGVAVQSGILAADPELLPIGSVVDLDAADTKYDGVYTVLDTGPSIQGRLVDVYMWSCNEALAFGHQSVRLNILRLGWNPKATTPGFFDRLFKRPATPALPSRPLPQVVPSEP